MKSNYSKDVPHEDLKVFKCATCEKDFGLNSDLNRHIKNVVIDRTSASSETSRTEFSAILCQKVRPKFGRTELS